MIVIAVLIFVLVGMYFDWFGGWGQSDVKDDSFFYDPASRTYVNTMPATNGDDGLDEPVYVGLEVLIRSGMTAAQYNVLKAALKGYAAENDINLKRVSYLHNSYSLAGLYVFDFSVVLNVDDLVLKVRADSSQGLKDILGMKVFMWNEAGEEVYYYEVGEGDKCQYLDEC